MSTLAIPVPIGPNALPPTAGPVRPGGVLSHVRRPCGAHGTEAYCVGRERDGSGLIYWCAEGHHHLTSSKR